MCAAPSPSRSARRRHWPATSALVEALCAALEAQGLGARRLDLLFHRVDNRVQAIRIGTAKPVRDVKRLTRLLTDRLETVDPGFGIEGMILVALLAEPLAYRQDDTLGRRADADVSALVDMLANRIGADKLYRVGAGGERSFPNARCAGSRRSRRRRARSGRRIGRGRAVCCRRPSRSIPSRCCPISRPSTSSGAGYAGA